MSDLKLNPQNSNPTQAPKRSVFFYLMGCGTLIVIALFLVVLLALILDDDAPSKNTSQPVAPTPVSTTSAPVSQPTPPPQNSSTVAPVLTFDQALQIIYPAGEYIPEAPYMDFGNFKGRANWQNGTLYRDVPIVDGIDETVPEADRYTRQITKVHDLVAFQQDGKSKAFVIMGSVPVNDPNSEPTLGAAVLVSQNGVWQLETRSDNLASISSDGDGGIVPGRLVKVGANRFGYMLDFGWIGQGMEVGMTRIIAQNYEFNIFPMGDIRNYGNNDGAGEDAPHYNYQSKIEVLENQANYNAPGDEDPAMEEYFPIRISRTGTCANIENQIVSINHQVVYQMYNEGYVPTIQYNSEDPINVSCSAD